MAEPLMAPRSYDYSGEADPRDARPYGISIESTTPRTGFLSKIDEIAGVLAPIVEAAAAFKRGYEGYPLPGRVEGDARMAGDRFVFQVLEDMRARNELAEERARMEREESRKSDMQQRLLLAGVQKGDITLADALKALQSGQFEVAKPEDRLPTQAPASGAR